MSELDIKDQINECLYEIMRSHINKEIVNLNDCLKGKTVKQLQDIARQLKIRKFSRMRKPQLIDAINNFYLYN